ncbi:MAG TPA: ferritin-like domain-containing protein, partial [Longimicrobium sp.]|nr:ferritin-like domain-containing protein [Longimicrobium sp.]
APVDTETTRLDAGTAPAATAEILDGLNDLLQLDHDAIGAYEIAMEKLHDRDHAAQIAGFRRDHERHIRELNELIAELGGTPVNQPHMTGPFKLALQSLGALAGDKGVLMAFRTNEMAVRAKYDSYAAKANLWPTSIKRIIDRCALDEERHYAWVADLLSRMGVGLGGGAGAEDKMNAARERANTVGGTLDQLRDRVSDVAGTVRDRLSGPVGAVTNRISGLMGGQHEDDLHSGMGGGPTVVDGVRDRVQTVAAGARGAGESFEDFYNERPLQVLLLAGIAGFIIGRMLR